MSRDPYTVLGVRYGATPEEIKKAFHKLAHVHHPDKGGDAEKFKEVSAAYALLKDKPVGAQPYYQPSSPHQSVFYQEMQKERDRAASRRAASDALYREQMRQQRMRTFYSTSEFVMDEMKTYSFGTDFQGNQIFQQFDPNTQSWKTVTKPPNPNNS